VLFGVLIKECRAYRIDHKIAILRLVSDHPSNEPTLSLIGIEEERA